MAIKARRMWAFVALIMAFGFCFGTGCETQGSITVYFYNTQELSSVFAYVAGGSLGERPGSEMEADGDGWYKIDVPIDPATEPFRIEFSDGGDSAVPVNINNRTMVYAIYDGRTFADKANAEAFATSGEAQLTHILAVYTRSSTVFAGASLDSLKSDLAVSAHYSDGTAQEVDPADYTLSGTLSTGISQVTVNYQGATYLVDIEVSAVFVTGITAVYTQGSAVVYENADINTLKQSTVVTAHYSDGSTSVLVGTDYTLSGTLSEGSALVTVSYGAVNTTIAVTVSKIPVAVTLSSISCSYQQTDALVAGSDINALKTNLTVTAHYSDQSTAVVEASQYTLSGTLSPPTSQITVTHTASGKTSTFTVNVTTETPTPSGGAEYPIEEAFTNYNGDKVFSVFAPKRGSYTVKITASGSGTVSAKINNLTTTSLALNQSAAVTLSQGINSIALSSSAISKIEVVGAEKAEYGATTLYTRYELEKGTLGGGATAITPSRAQFVEAGEASGRSAAKLSAVGQSVSITLTKPANAFTLRYSIPDSSNGGGIDSTLAFYVNNTFNRNLDVNSRHAWLYGEYGADNAGQQWSNNPYDNSPKVFFSESRYKLGQTYPAGTVFKFQRDASSTASYYTLDLVEAEEIDTPNSMPSGAIRVNGNNRAAFDSAIGQAQSSASKTVYFPEGEFNLNDNGRDWIEIPEGIKIVGAGMWHTTITGSVRFLPKGNNASVSDLFMLGQETIRRNTEGKTAFVEGDYAGFQVQNVWLTYYKVGFWFAQNGSYYRIAGNRVRNTYADGINIQGAPHSIIEHNDFRNTGDDSIAEWSVNGRNDGNVVQYNSITAPWLASGISLYNGKNHTVRNNHITDIVFAGAGIHISTDYDSSATMQGYVNVVGNVLERAGSKGNSNKQSAELGAIWFDTQTRRSENNNATITVSGNVISDSAFHAFTVVGTGNSYDNGSLAGAVNITNNTVALNGSYSLLRVYSNEKGSLTIKNNTVTGGGTQITNYSGSFTVRTS